MKVSYAMSNGGRTFSNLTNGDEAIFAAWQFESDGTIKVVTIMKPIANKLVELGYIVDTNTTIASDDMSAYPVYKLTETGSLRHAFLNL